jgi:cell division protease FtsH
MICIYGMSEKIGLAHCAQRPNQFLIGAQDGQFQRDCSEATAREIDEEVKKLLDRVYSEAKEILTAFRHELELVVRELLKTESIDGATFYKLIGKTAPERRRDPVAAAIS